MIEEIVVHKVPVALVMLVRQTDILVHVECNDILEGDLAGLVLTDQFSIHTQRGGAGRQTKNKRTILLVTIDLRHDVIGCPLAHLFVVFLNYNSHITFSPEAVRPQTVLRRSDLSNTCSGTERFLTVL